MMIRWTNFPPKQEKDWEKKIESNNKSIALNISFLPYNNEEIGLAYKSKYIYKRENQVILSMITDGKKWDYLAVKSLLALLRGITSNHIGDFHFLNCLHSYSTKNKLKRHERVCNDHGYCCIEMPNEDNKILKYNHGEKSVKGTFIIYADLKCLLEEMHSCQNNNEKSYTEKKTVHTPSGHSIFANYSFDSTELYSTKNKLDCYRSKDCMERFCKDLKKHSTRIINYEKKRNDTANW